MVWKSVQGCYQFRTGGDFDDKTSWKVKKSAPNIDSVNFVNLPFEAKFLEKHLKVSKSLYNDFKNMTSNLRYKKKLPAVDKAIIWDWHSFSTEISGFMLYRKLRLKIRCRNQTNGFLQVYQKNDIHEKALVLVSITTVLL